MPGVSLLELWGQRRLMFCHVVNPYALDLCHACSWRAGDRRGVSASTLRPKDLTSAVSALGRAQSR